MANNQLTSGSSALQLAKRTDPTPLIKIDTLDDVMTLGKVLAASGYFQDARDAGQAVVKVLAGRELGFPAIASMTGIYIVKGKVSLSANLMAAAIKRSGRYNYRVKSLTDAGCEIAFFENGEECGISSFGQADAVAAGLAGEANYKKFPRNMFFSRALSNGAKWFCPDLSGGGPVYTPDELGARVDGETGEVIDAQPEPQSPRQSVEALSQRITKVDGGYDCDENGELHSIRKENGRIICTCSERDDCLHRVALKLFIAREKALVAVEEPETPNETPQFQNPEHAAAFEMQAPSEPAGDEHIITKSQLITLADLCKEMEAAGIEEETWRNYLERITGQRTRKGLLQADLAKIMHSFRQALAAAEKKGASRKGSQK